MLASSVVCGTERGCARAVRRSDVHRREHVSVADLLLHRQGARERAQVEEVALRARPRPNPARRQRLRDGADLDLPGRVVAESLPGGEARVDVGVGCQASPAMLRRPRSTPLFSLEKLLPDISTFLLCASAELATNKEAATTRFRRATLRILKPRGSPGVADLRSVRPIPSTLRSPR